MRVYLVHGLVVDAFNTKGLEDDLEACLTNSLTSTTQEEEENEYVKFLEASPPHSRLKKLPIEDI